MPMYRKSMLVLILLLLAGIGGTLYGLYGQEKMDTLDCAEELPENKAAYYIYFKRRQTWIHLLNYGHLCVRT